MRTTEHLEGSAEMTAIGLLMCVSGWLLVRTYGSPYESMDMWNMCDKVGIFLLFVGFALLNIGVFMKLWEVMP
jgi:uncharacterized membrane protein HdeD (DUF308 family)